MSVAQNILFCFLVLVQSFGAALAAERLALVIGNSKYEHLGTLPNTLNDATSMSRSLTEMGYETTTLIDASDAELRRALRAFSLKSSGASIALVFYAGHGAQVNGENYLLPIDIEPPKRESDIRLSSIKVDDVINSLQSKTKVLFLDACRDNPALLKSLASGRGTYRGGLAPANSSSVDSAGVGVFIAYATDAGSVALDSVGKDNSPFTSALLNHIKKPMSIDDMFSMVTRDVRQATKNVQRPYKYASMDGVVCLTTSCVPAAKEPSVTGINESILSEQEFVLVNFGQDPKVLVYLDVKSIKQKGSRRWYKTKYIYEGPNKFFDPKAKTVLQGSVVDCKTNYSQSYQTSQYDYSGKLIEDFQVGLPELVELTVELKSGSLGWSTNLLVCNPLMSHPNFLKNSEESFKWRRLITLEHGGAIYFSESSVIKNGGLIELLGKITFPATPIGELNSKYKYSTGFDGVLNTPDVTKLITIVKIDCKKNIHSQNPDYFFDGKNNLIAYSRYTPDFDKTIKIEPGPVQMVAALLCD